MRLTGFVGVVLIVLGVVVLAANGIRYTKERHSTDIGPFQVSTVKKGSVSPTAGVVADALNAVDRHARDGCDPGLASNADQHTGTLDTGRRSNIDVSLNAVVE